MISRYLYKLIVLAASLCIFALLFTACGNNNGAEGTTNEAPVLSTTSAATERNESTTSKSSSGNVSAEKIDTYIILDDNATVINGEGASFENSVLTITQSGTYSLEGTLTDGKIFINSPDEEKKVKLLLNGVSVSCSTDAPLFVENSPKETILILAESSVNNFSDTQREVPADENADYATATIYAKDDLQIEGNGTINVKGNFNKGIFSKKDIDIQGGTINIDSVDDGIRGKDSVEISGGILNITCGGDGIRTNETAQEGKGNIIISGGDITVKSELDCIQSVKNITVNGGTFNLTSGGGATKEASNSEDMGPMGGKGPMGGDRGGRGNRPDGGMFGMYGGGPRPKDSSANEDQKEDTPSTKGIKADGTITVNGGSFTVSSADDSIHSVKLSINGGAFTLESDDDGIHADDLLEIDSGAIDIAYSYEGLEGKVINITNGAINIKATDDGINAAGDTTSNNPMQADYSCEINVSGGYIHIDADGDGIDSNGNVNQTGGTLIVFGPQSGANGALDYGGKYTVSGGTLLASGAQGMAQSVTGDGIEVLAFTYSCSADTLNAITDSKGNALIGFRSPKSFGTVVFVSDKLKTGESYSVYSVYSGGSFNTEEENGIWLKGDYTKGTLVGTLS